MIESEVKSSRYSAEPVPDIITGELIDPRHYTKPWFSASLISDYISCPAKAYARITKQKQLQPAIALINGSAAHWGMEIWLKERKDPIKGFTDFFKIECEKQGVDWKLPTIQKKILEGEKMMACTWKQFQDPGFLAKVDPNLVEAGFRIGRDGRIFVGKLDLIFFKEPKRYNIVDFKSGSKPPKMEIVDGKEFSYKLFNDLQFNMYPWATYNDPKLPTCGIWPEYATWFHMQGQNIGTEPVKHKDGTIGTQTAKKEENKVWKFDFSVYPTPESVERIFRDTIDPYCDDIEEGRWKRNRSDEWNGCSGCTYFNKKTGDCGVELPGDGLAERGNQINLIDRADLGGKAA